MLFRSGLYLGSFYGPYGFVVTPRYTGEDSFANVAAVTVSVLTVPVAYIGALIVCSMLFYRHQLKRPIGVLTRGSARIARNDLDFTIDYDSQNELGQLCDSLRPCAARWCAATRSSGGAWRSASA